MEKISSFLKEEKVILFIVLFAFLLRLLFRSPWLEDWDSVQFALALHDYSLVDHQPHPPGYILYVLLGKFINFFLNNDTLALTLLSAVLGALTTIPFYLLARKFTGKVWAILATAILLVTPIHWTLSEVALTNVPGMFFAVTTALILYQGKQSRLYLLAGSFLAGITLGVRFAEYSILLTLLGLVLLWRKNWWDVIKSGVYFSAGIFVWLVPLIIDTGWQELMRAYTTQANYIATHDSLAASLSMSSRLLRIKELFVMGYSVYFFPLLILIAWFLIKYREEIKQFKNTFLLVWLLAYFIPLAFIYNLEVPRHVLPLLPPLALLIGSALKKLKNQKSSTVIFVGILIAMFSKSLDQVQKIHTLTPPTIAPVSYVKEKFDPETTILITTFTYRQFQYYAPEFTNFYADVTEKTQLKDNVVTDSVKIKEQIPILAEYRTVSKKSFWGPEDIFPRISYTNLYFLQKN
ncbi:MAG: glycosyltransferase family 39 protein [bacterium]|nr:glycosyltransferase family 39 protein [bacterium]